MQFGGSDWLEDMPFFYFISISLCLSLGFFFSFFFLLCGRAVLVWQSFPIDILDSKQLQQSTRKVSSNKKIGLDEWIVNTTTILIYDTVIDGKIEAITTLVIINNVKRNQIVKLIEAIFMQGSHFLCAPMRISSKVYDLYKYCRTKILHPLVSHNSNSI